MPKFSDGCFTFFKVRKDFLPLAPERIQEIAERRNIPLSIVPQYAGHRAICARAISATQAQITKDGWLLRKIVAEKVRVVYGIVAEEKNTEEQTLTHSHEASCEWALETDGGVAVHGNHPIARLVDDTFQSLLGLVAAADWTEVITAYLLGECAAIPMRDDGRVWWVSPAAVARLDELTLFLDEIGISMIKCDIEPAARTVVQEAVEDSLASRLKELQDEVEAFDGTQRPATYKDRLATYAQLKKRCQTYQSVLGVGIADAEEALVALEAKVCDLLLVRQSTTIHKDGSMTVADMNPEVPTFDTPEAVVF